MPKVYLDRSGRIVFYGNPAGYVSGGSAVMDRLFQTSELSAFLEGQGLSAVWQDGVYDRLAAGLPAAEPGVPAASAAVTPLRSVRIWQLKANSDIGLKFIAYRDACERFGGVELKNYRCVWDGRLDTNDLEEIYEHFNGTLPPTFEGHPLSMSDVVELCGDGESSFHYCDRRGFAALPFQSPQQTE